MKHQDKEPVGYVLIEFSKLLNLLDCQQDENAVGTILDEMKISLFFKLEVVSCKLRKL